MSIGMKVLEKLENDSFMDDVSNKLMPLHRHKTRADLAAIIEREFGIVELVDTLTLTREVLKNMCATYGTAMPAWNALETSRLVLGEFKLSEQQEVVK